MSGEAELTWVAIITYQQSHTTEWQTANILVQTVSLAHIFLFSKFLQLGIHFQ